MTNIQEEAQACCEMMSMQAANLSLFTVEDPVITYVKVFDEYGIAVKDGGTSKIRIKYCPWCGTRLPESKKDRWYDELEQLGISDPDDPRIPDSYRTDLWWRKR